MGDQIEKRGTSTFCCSCDRGSYKGFVIELGLIAVVKLKNAVLANPVGGAVIVGACWFLVADVIPSWVGMQARQVSLYQGNEKLARYINRRHLMVLKIPLR